MSAARARCLLDAGGWPGLDDDDADPDDYEDDIGDYLEEEAREEGEEQEEGDEGGEGAEDDEGQEEEEPSEQLRSSVGSPRHDLL